MIKFKGEYTVRINLEIDDADIDVLPLEEMEENLKDFPLDMQEVLEDELLEEGVTGKVKVTEKKFTLDKIDE